MGKNINEVEIDHSNIDWKAVAKAAIEFEKKLEGQGWNGCVSAGCPDSELTAEEKKEEFTAKQKLNLIRMRVGLTLGLAAKNDNQGMVSLSTDIINIIDGKKTY